MIPGIIFMILASIMLGIHYLLLKSNKEEMNRKWYTGTGNIEKVITNNSGNVRYYIGFYHEDIKLVGESRYYPSSLNVKHIGEVVPIKYFFTKENNPRIVIDNAMMIPCGGDMIYKSNIFLKISIPLGILAIISFIISFI